MSRDWGQIKSVREALAGLVGPEAVDLAVLTLETSGFKILPLGPSEGPKWQLDNETGCWNWMRARDPNGYGNVWYAGQFHKAHRLAYQLMVGPIPEGLTIDHLCRNTSCINPDHLEVVTQQVNILRSTGMSALHARKTHCVNGHPFDRENTYIRKDNGGRQCKACMRDRRRKPRETAA